MSRRIRYCKVRGCDGRVVGRAATIAPLCPSCRWLGSRALIAGGVLFGVVKALIFFWLKGRF
jgi:hypothetical protein